MIKKRPTTVLEMVFIVSSLVIWKYTNGEKEDYNHNQRIRTELLKNYDKKSLPHIDANGTTSVNVRLSVSNIWIDEDTQILTLSSLISFVWQEDRLKWDYKDYGDLKLAHFGDDELWKPDLQVYNSAEPSEMDHYGNVHFLVYNDGTVLWVPPATFKVVCLMDITLWPFDQHVCSIELGSWTTHGWQIDFNLGSNSSEISYWNFIPKVNKWKIVNSSQVKLTTYYECCKEPYVTLVFTLELKRSSPSFATTVVIPAVVLPLFLMIQFILPVDHPKRLSIGFLCTFLFFLELLFLKASLPKLGASIPLIVSYYGLAFVISALTVALSAVLGRLVHRQDPLLAFAPPELLKRFLTGPLAIILCLSEHANKVGLSSKMEEDGEVLETSKTPDFSHEWLLVAKSVDRIFFFFFICVFILALIGFVSPLK